MSPVPFTKQNVWYPPPGYVNTTLPPALYGINTDQITVAGAGLLSTLRDLVTSRQTVLKLTRTTTAASTITVTVDDPDRAVLRSPIANAGYVLQVPTTPVTMFKLVQVAKGSGDTLTLTWEDYYINCLRKKTGRWTMSTAQLGDPGTNWRGWFLTQLCNRAFVPSHSAPRASFNPVRQPLAVGSQDNPDEDYWTAATRVAKDIQLRIFSEGPAIWWGPDWWFQTGIAPPVAMAEFTDAILGLSFDHDVGKPVSTAKIASTADAWKVGLARPISLTGCGVADGVWLVSDIDRPDMNKLPITVSLERFKAELAEPVQGDAHQVSFTAH